MKLERVHLCDIRDFRQMVEAYWQEIMPHSDVAKSYESREAYFQERFPFNDDELHLFWGVVNGRKRGFVAFTVNEAKHSAMIEDFFMAAEFRRQGYGTAMIKAVFTELNQLGVELIELNVRRDSPQALAFWEAQGFRIALYRLRQFRDPKRGTSYIGDRYWLDESRCVRQTQWRGATSRWAASKEEAFSDLPTMWLKSVRTIFDEVDSDWTSDVEKWLSGE